MKSKSVPGFLSYIHAQNLKLLSGFPVSGDPGMTLVRKSNPIFQYWDAVMLGKQSIQTEELLTH